MNNKIMLALTLVLFILGLLLSLQFRTQKLLASSLEAQKTEDLVIMWRNLNDKRNQLQEEIAKLQQQLSVVAQEAEASPEAERAMEKELGRLEMNLGVVPVKGPGITVTITGEAPLLAEDLVDIINELWASGAEAVAVNEHRINFYSSIGRREEGNRLYLTVNQQKLLYPVVIKAIGDPHTLEKGLTFTGGVLDNLANLFNIHPVIKKEESLQLPAASPPRWQYASPAK